VAVAHDRGNLLGGIRQHDRERHLAIGGQAVGLVRFQPQRFGDHRLVWQQGAQAGHDSVAARQDFGLWFRLLDHGSENGPATGARQAGPGRGVAVTARWMELRPAWAALRNSSRPGETAPRGSAISRRSEEMMMDLDQYPESPHG